MLKIGIDLLLFEKHLPKIRLLREKHLPLVRAASPAKPSSAQLFTVSEIQLPGICPGAP